MFLETIDKLKVVPYEKKIKPWYFYDTTYMMVLDKYITKEDHLDLWKYLKERFDQHKCIWS